MATSNSFTFTDTAGSVINDAMSFIGKFDPSQSLSAHDYNLALRALNRICKQVQLKNDYSSGNKLWQRQVGFLFLNPTTGQYTLEANQPYWCNSFFTLNSTGNNAANQNVVNLSNTSAVNVGMTIGLILDTNVLQYVTVAAVNVNTSTVNVSTNLQASMNGTNDLAYVITDYAQPPQIINGVSLRDQFGNDLDLDILTYEQYQGLPAKNQPQNKGNPTAIYYESHLVGNSGQGFGYLNTDVAAAIDLTRYLVVYYCRELQDLVNPTDELDFPKEWLRAIVFNLAGDLVPHFNAPWSQKQEDLAKQSWKIASSANPKRSAAVFSRGPKNNTFYTPPHR